MTTLEAQFKAAAIEMITRTFGRAELPSSNKPAQFVTTTSGGYRDSSTVNEEVEDCLRVSYTLNEQAKAEILTSDVRFIIIADRVTTKPQPDNTNIIWDNLEYNVVKVDNINGIVYDIQARLL